MHARIQVQQFVVWKNDVPNRILWRRLALLFLCGIAALTETLSTTHAPGPGGYGTRFREHLLPVWTKPPFSDHLHFDLDGELATDGAGVYRLSPSGWKQEALFQAVFLRHRRNAAAVFGETVAISGEDASTSLEYVSIYQNSPSGWVLEAQLSNPDPRDDGCGADLAMDRGTLAVLGNTNLHVLVNDDVGWSLQAQLSPSIGTPYYLRK